MSAPLRRVPRDLSVHRGFTFIRDSVRAAGGRLDEGREAIAVAKARAINIRGAEPRCRSTGQQSNACRRTRHASPGCDAIRGGKWDMISFAQKHPDPPSQRLWRTRGWTPSGVGAEK